MISNTSGRLYQALSDWQTENRILTEEEINGVIEEIEEHANT
jgi:hypothetical protein